MTLSSTMAICALAIGRETLSAWRDEALTAAEAANLAQHVETCAACQATLAEFSFVEQTLAAQSVPPVPPQTWSQLQQVVARQPQVRRRRRVALGIGVASIALAIILVMVLLLPHWMQIPTQIIAMSNGTSAPTAIPHPFDQGLIYDPTVGNDLPFAFVDGNDLAIRRQGHVLSVPISVPGVAGTKWGIAWAPDQSRLLVTTQQPGKAASAWTVFLPSDVATALPAASPLVAACVGNVDGTMPCQWLLDRYILYPQRSAASPDDAAFYGLYDLQTQQVIPSTLSQKLMEYAPVVRGPYVFFTPYGQSTILRYDSVTNSIAPLVATLPGTVLASDNRAAGGWSLAADTQSLFFAAAQPSSATCGVAIRCYTFYLVANTTNPTPSSSALDSDLVAHIQDQSLSPNGRQAVALVLDAQGEQVVSAYQYEDLQHTTTTVATLNLSGSSALSFLGWVHTRTGETALLRQVQLDATYQPMATTIYQDGNGFMPVMTVTNKLVVFAPPYES